jgi:hypothetical protein
VLSLVWPQRDAREHLVFRVPSARLDDVVWLDRAVAGIGWFLPRHQAVAVLPPGLARRLDAAFVPLS